MSIPYREALEWMISLRMLWGVIRVKNPGRLLVPLGSSFHSPVGRCPLLCLYSILQVPTKPYIALPSAPWLCGTLCLDINLRISVACKHDRELCILNKVNNVRLEPLLTPVQLGNPICPTSPNPAATGKEQRIGTKSLVPHFWQPMQPTFLTWPAHPRAHSGP